MAQGVRHEHHRLAGDVLAAQGLLPDRVPPEQVIAGITANMPLGEIPTDGDVADAVVFFASDLARMVTAQTFMINAGEFPH